jgi:hypothetical protein
MSATRERRRIRRAIGPQAADALLDMDARSMDVERFLLLAHARWPWRRIWWLLTGRF